MTIHPEPGGAPLRIFGENPKGTPDGFVPKLAFLTKGVGRDKNRLTSFELALREAGIAPQNLVMVSSIFPPGCKLVPRSEGAKMLRPGQITFCVMSRCESDEPSRLIAVSVGLALPADSEQYGYISEHHSYGETEERAGEYGEDLAASMLALTLGIEFDPNTAWDEREQLYKASGKIIRTQNITQSALGDKDGRWTTVIAAVVFLL